MLNGKAPYIKTNSVTPVASKLDVKHKMTIIDQSAKKPQKTMHTSNNFFTVNSITSISNSGFLTVTDKANPFSLQISRSKANIQAFHSTAGKRNSQELNAYKSPLSGNNGGLMTHNVLSGHKDYSASKRAISRTESRKSNQEQRMNDYEARRGPSFAKMKPRDDLMYKVSDVSFLRK